MYQIQDGLDVPKLLETTKAYLEEMNSLGEEDDLQVDPQVCSVLEQRRDAVVLELQSKSDEHAFPILVLFTIYESCSMLACIWF